MATSGLRFLVDVLCQPSCLAQQAVFLVLDGKRLQLRFLDLLEGGVQSLFTGSSVAAFIWCLKSRLGLRPESPFTRVFGPNSAKKNFKKSFWGVRQKVLTFSGIFGDFLADPQKDSFSDFFCVFGAAGQGDSCKRRLGPQNDEQNCKTHKYNSTPRLAKLVSL